MICSMWKTKTFNVCLLCLPYWSIGRCCCSKKNAQSPKKKKKNRLYTMSHLRLSSSYQDVGSFFPIKCIWLPKIKYSLYKQSMFFIYFPHTYFIFIGIITWFSKQIRFSQIKCQALLSAIFSTKYHKGGYFWKL